MDDLISRQAAIDALKHNQDVYSHNFHDDPIDKYTVAIIAADIDSLINLPSAQPQYIELTPEEAASEIASGSIMSASYWLDAMIRLKQMGYAICRKKG